MTGFNSLGPMNRDASAAYAGTRLSVTLSRIRDGLDSLQVDHRGWVEHNFPGEKGWECLLGVMEELGELAHAHLKGVNGIRHTEEEIRRKKVDAIADMVIFLCGYCDAEGIELGDAVADTWAEVRRRDWKKDPTGGGAT